MRVLPPILFALCAAAMLGANWLLPDDQIIPETLRLWGWLLFALGLLILVAARMQFLRHKANIYTFDKPTALITDGVFGWSRNPMYLGFVLAAFGLAWVFGGGIPFVIAALFLLANAIWYIPFEERAMREAFGQDYADYAAKTRRWL